MTIHAKAYFTPPIKPTSWFIIYMVYYTKLKISAMMKCFPMNLLYLSAWKPGCLFLINDHWPNIYIHPFCILHRCLFTLEYWTPVFIWAQVFIWVLLLYGWIQCIFKVWLVNFPNKLKMQIKVGGFVQIVINYNDTVIIHYGHWSLT